MNMPAMNSQAMKISVIGCGYLGAVHAATLASMGHTVVGIDVDTAKVAELGRGAAPFHEPGLDELLTLEGRLVLGVFPQVTQLDGLGDRLGKKDIEFMAELVDLTAQLLTHFLDHMKPDEVEAPGDGNRQASKGVPTVKDTAGPAFRKVPAAEVYDS